MGERQGIYYLQMRKQPLLTRFNEKWTPEPFSGCWLWTAAVQQQRYGIIWDNNAVLFAHRASWILHRGFIPDAGNMGSVIRVI